MGCGENRPATVHAARFGTAPPGGGPGSVQGASETPASTSAQRRCPALSQPIWYWRPNQRAANASSISPRSSTSSLSVRTPVESLYGSPDKAAGASRTINGFVSSRGPSSASSFARSSVTAGTTARFQVESPVQALTVAPEPPSMVVEAYPCGLPPVRQA